MNEKYIGYRQASELLGIKVATLYSLVHREEIPHVRISKRLVRFNLSELETWLAGKARGIKEKRGIKR